MYTSYNEKNKQNKYLNTHYWNMSLL